MLQMSGIHIFIILTAAVTHHASSSFLRRTWLLITVSLTSLLLAGLLAHIVWVYRSSAAAHFPDRRDYSYVPLTNINGASLDGADAGKSRHEVSVRDDSDSQDEIWSPTSSRRS